MRPLALVLRVLATAWSWCAGRTPRPSRASPGTDDSGPQRVQSPGVMGNRAGDWLSQAERDLEQAMASERDDRHEWACFAAHQSAEKAVKALHLHNGQEAWGHVVARLVRQLPLEYDPLLVEKARVLDSFYVPTRYPNGHPDGAPFEHYGGLQSEEAIRYAGEILEFVRAQMA